jgi:hypothetical protein
MQMVFSWIIHIEKQEPQPNNPYLDVTDGCIRMAWIADSGDGHPDYMERIDLIGLGITYICSSIP